MTDLLLAGMLGWLFFTVGFLIMLTARAPGYEKPAIKVVRIVVRFSGVIMFLGGIASILAAIFVGIFGPWI